MINVRGTTPGVVIAWIVSVCSLLPATAYGQFVVDAGGGGTHTSIQTAINDAVDGFDIVVMPGVYFERISFSGKAVRVRGSSPLDRTVVDATIVDGAGVGSVVTFDSGEGLGSVLEGLTIRGGLSIAHGGGIVCVAGSSPSILHNVIASNASTDNGGGLYCADGASPLVQFNVIFGNRSDSRGGGVYCEASSPVLRQNVIDANLAGCSSGGGIYLAAGSDSAVVEANEITRNFARLGGGIAVANANVRIERNRLINNYGVPRAGALSFTNADVTLVSNVIAGNRSPIAAAIDSAQSSAVVRGNTFVGNWATDDVILLFLGSSQPELTGNIIAFSEAGVSVFAVAGASLVADYNCFFGNPGGDTSGTVTLGANNVFADPGILDAGTWAPPLLIDATEVPCDAGARTELIANYEGPASARGFAQYRLRPDRERFDVELYNFPSGAHGVSVGGLPVGQVFVDGGGTGILEFDTNDGTFPPGFPEVSMGDNVSIGNITAAPLGPAWSGSNEQWVNGNAHLQSSSLVRDSGPTSVPPEDAADIDGQPRLAGSATDIGADEIVPPGDGDFDADGDVDFADARSFQLCFRGAAGLIPDPACSTLDLDGDADVDLTDWEAFTNRVTGPQ